MNFFGFLLFFISTGLTVCYSFRMFYYVLSGDFNLFPFYFMGEENLSIIKGILGLFNYSCLRGKNTEMDNFS
jgi:NADH-ubiquinone oxidoreductase chain 5